MPQYSWRRSERAHSSAGTSTMTAGCVQDSRCRSAGQDDIERIEQMEAPASTSTKLVLAIARDPGDHVARRRGHPARQAPAQTTVGPSIHDTICAGCPSRRMIHQLQRPIGTAVVDQDHFERRHVDGALGDHSTLLNNESLFVECGNHDDRLNWATTVTPPAVSCRRPARAHRREPLGQARRRCG